MTRDESGLSGTLLIGTWVLATMFLWGFAFFHLPDATPEWLLSAQSACFGTNESGLPDTSGWMLLVLAPASMLLAMLVSLRRELRAGTEYLRSSPFGKALSMLVLLIALAETGWVISRIDQGLEVAYASYESEDYGTLPQNYPHTSRTAPGFTLLDQHGAKISLDSLAGESVILTFAFAHCSTICPVLVKNAMAAHAKLNAHSAKLLIITLDPWRDTPSSLPALAKRWELTSNQHVLSGTVEEVESVIKSYGVTTQRDLKSGDVVHPALSFVIDRAGKLAYTFNGATSDWIVTAVARAEAQEEEV